MKDIGNSNNTYLTFYLDGEMFGLNIHMVREVLEYTAITRVPMTVDFMRGVINVRGRVVPVMDLRRKFSLPATAPTIQTCIIIVDLNVDGESSILGALVDDVQEVLDILPDQIEAAPRLSGKINRQFIHGIGKLGDRFVMLLDMRAVFSLEELNAITEINHQEESSRQAICA
ncbi:MAG: chemotaxis protein CheW [Thermodesulfobacteriota bacterium]